MGNLLGKELKLLRQAARLTPEGMAFVTGFSPAELESVESGVKHPSKGVLHQIAEALEDVPRARGRIFAADLCGQIPDYLYGLKDADRDYVVDAAVYTLQQFRAGVVL